MTRALCAFLTTAVLPAAGCTLVAPSDELLSGGDDRTAPPPGVSYWLAAHRGGFCGARPGQALALCRSTFVAPFLDPNGDGNMCFDDDDLRRRARLRRTYPDGLSLDVGFHWDGSGRGHILTLGSTDHLSLDCDPTLPGTRIVLKLDGEGHLQAIFPGGVTLRDGAPLASGTRLASVRAHPSGTALFVDGALVDQGPGLAVPFVFEERWSPGIVLGENNQRWWACEADGSRRWMRMAAFFFHLRDEASAPTVFRETDALVPNEGTVLLYDPSGAQEQLWSPSVVADDPSWTTELRSRFVGRLRGGTWVDDVLADCW